MTHTVDLPPGVYDEVTRGLAMLNTGLFTEHVSEGDFVRISKQGTQVNVIGRVTGIAAIVEIVTTPHE